MSQSIGYARVSRRDQDPAAQKAELIAAGSITTDTWTDPEAGANRYKQVVMADAIGKSL